MQKINLIEKAREGPSTSTNKVGNIRLNSKRTRNQDDVHNEPILEDISFETAGAGNDIDIDIDKITNCDRTKKTR